MRRFIIALVMACLALTASTAVGLGVIHITGQPYKHDVRSLKIAESSGVTESEIMENYNAVMGYLSPFSVEGFSLPTLKYSVTGKGHFEDCKVIFNYVYALGLASLALFILMRRLCHRDSKTLTLSGTLTLAIPAALGIAAAVDFNGLFVLFHKVFFTGDTWIFDPEVDEIIKILPETFFMHCALFIASFWVLSALIQFIFGSMGTKRR